MHASTHHLFSYLKTRRGAFTYLLQIRTGARVAKEYLISRAQNLFFFISLNASKKPAPNKIVISAAKYGIVSVISPVV